MTKHSRAETSAARERRQAEISAPVRVHQPRLGAEIDTGRAPRTTKQRIKAAAGIAAIAALVLPAALPALSGVFGTQAEASDLSQTGASAAAQQQLFSEVSVDDMPDAFSEITAAPVESDEPTKYVFKANAVVNYPFASPVLLTDGFGYRTAPVEQFHDAQDFAASEGTPIQAIADGVVLEAGFDSDGCGFGLKLEHEIDGKTVTSRYCHMQSDSHDYQIGDTLSMGDPVGRVGATGMAFGAHLHLAIRVDDEPTDPLAFLAKYSQVQRDEDSADDSAEAEESDA